MPQAFPRRAPRPASRIPRPASRAPRPASRATFPTSVNELVFFYGTLMAGFDRRRRAGIDDKLRYIGRGAIAGALFDLGLYPALVAATDGRVWGEVYEMTDAPVVLAALDDIEGYRPDDPDSSLYLRAQTEVTLPDGSQAQAWAYFYNAPLGKAARIPSGDYLEHVKVR